MEDFKQNMEERLQELDCDENMIEMVMNRLIAGDKETARRFLRRHRKTLMDNMHESQKKVDDLDFLIYQIDKDKLEYLGSENQR
jgi:uncharacterized protein (UPF0216 family)